MFRNIKIVDWGEVPEFDMIINATSIGLEKNDILWTVPITWPASANCGLYCGAKVDFVDIEVKTKLQKEYSIVVVPTIVILQYDEEKKRYQADLSFKLSATKEEIQDAIDELVLSGF